MKSNNKQPMGIQSKPSVTMAGKSVMIDDEFIDQNRISALSGNDLANAAAESDE